eukprot:CAMPEP_0197323594 /NCGR_PEP_ID=MMETSP0891-20130614/70619_1 /TAXON_ID=44058 ORGANISM="Aureoumbra lagunensis, Strain CCMP1510" /NCGR_SAMPLE_ID=MMETSP0891 /ASSEMBLY_ACC=CAM_ASM_000534 /LENGTH=549 /DNA_ID=CAMNT_0042816277 /DNA_START=534 /DNA_END=2183 /DNA_ORIENTATION=-
MKDYPKPNVENTQPYRDATKLSERFSSDLKADSSQKKKIAIIGGGLSGLSCAKYLSDAGHEPTIYEARDVLGGKVSAWQDEDGDWIETGLHIFFGAYPNMLNLLAELNLRNRLQWKAHRMSFAMREKPGEFTSFEFPQNVPAPFNMAYAILTNDEMLSLVDKIRMIPGLLPMLLQGQQFIDAQDEVSVLQFMQKYGMPDRVNKEIFIAMAKALDFLDPEDMSMTVILTAMNRFINEADGSQTAFLDGNQSDRLCAPIKEYIKNCGGNVYTSKPLREIIIDGDDDMHQIKCLRLANNEIIQADEYISAMPVDCLKRFIPRQWSTMPFFRQLDELEGVPVINLQIWLNKRLSTSLDGLAFSRSPLLSVYADLAKSVREYSSDNSILSLVFAPVVPNDTNINWLARSDDEIIHATVQELERLFPGDISINNVRKAAVVRTPRSVYAAIPGRNKYRPSQATPIPNFSLCGCFTSQKFLGSMEGAVLAGKLAARVVAHRHADNPQTLAPQIKPIPEHIVSANYEPRSPKLRSDNSGEKEGAIAFGGGECALPGR